MNMDYKQALNTNAVDSNEVLKIEANLTLDDALQQINNHIALNKSSTSNTVDIPDALLQNDGIEHLYMQLKDYWSQFGLMDKSKYIDFCQVLQTGLNLKINSIPEED